MSNFKIADPKLADAGRLRIEWAESRMPVLMALREKGKKDQPLKGMKVAGCLHVTKETAVLIRTLRAAGAEVSLVGLQPAVAPTTRSPPRWPPRAPRSTPGTACRRDEFYWCIDQHPRVQADADARRRRRPHLHGARQAPGAGQGRHRRHRGDHHRRAPPARDGRRRQAALPGLSRSTTARPSGTSTTSTAPASRRSTASCAPPACCSPARPSSSPATATAAAASPCAPRGMGANVIVTEIKPTAGAQGDARGLPRHADGRGRQARRHLHHRHRHEGHPRRPPLRRR